MQDTCVEGLLTLLVRGVHFEIPTHILKEDPATKFSRLLKDISKSQRVSLVGRDPTIFSSVIGFYTSGTLHVPRGACARLVKEELEFWEIPETTLCLSCYKRYREELDEVDDVENCIKLWRKQSVSSGDNLIKVASEKMHDETSRESVREQLWTFLERPSSSKWAAMYTAFMMLMNLMSVLLPTLETVPSMRDPKSHKLDESLPKDILSAPRANFNSTLELVHASVPKSWILIVDAVLVGILTVDLILRLCATRLKARFFKSFINIIGIISLIPIWIQVIIYKTMRFVDVPYYALDIVHNLMALSVLRVIYLFRMANWYKPMRIILMALKESRRELFLLAVILTLNSVFFGFLVYTLEMEKDTFWSIPEGIYWAVITMTTVGYGDMYPVAAGGRIIGCCCALSGILLIALPVPVIANNFIKFYAISKLTNRQENTK